MKTSTKALLVSLLIVMLPISMILAYLYLYIPSLYTPEKLQKEGEKAFLEGREFGKTTNEQGCFVEATTRAANRTLYATNGRPWLSGCLYASEMSPGFCDGILPPKKEPDLERQTAICAERKVGEYCLYFMPVVEEFCRE
jgi:hypothetical protein